MGRRPNLGGRPSKLTATQRKEVFEALQKYIAETDFPTVAGFLSNDPVSLKYWVNRDNLRDWPEFGDLTKRAYIKQEDYLVKQGMKGTQNTTMSIFLLKQQWIGYRDKFEQDITSGGKEITFVNAVPRPNEIKVRKKRK